MRKRSKRLEWETLPCVHPHAAGLDIGAREIWACVPSDRDSEPVRRFGTFTPDRVALVDWLVRCGVDTVAMEATGVYWIPVFELLEARGLKAYLVNAQHLQRVPGRKSDFLDCQWIQKMHRLGLLAASFRPDAEMCGLRADLRHRAQLLQHRAPHILHIQKALHPMNVQLTQVLTDVTGVTGLAIIRAIVAGERDPVKLARLCNPMCHSSEDEIAKALTGAWQPEHLFVLKQSLELYDFYTAQVAACDAVLEQHFSAMKPRCEAAPVADLPRVKRGSKSKNQPALNVRAHLYRLTGVDVVAVHGISASIAQTILAETGTDVTKWPTEKHFASWLGLAPHNDISGGKVLRSRTLSTSNRAGQAFRQAAQSVARSECAFGAFYRRLKGRVGPEQAMVATAHRIARTVYCLLKEHVQYHDLGAQAYDQRQRDQELGRLKRHAATLGFMLTPHAPELAPAGA